MSKSSKILISAIAATLVICALIIAISMGVRKKNNPETVTTTESASSTSSYFDIDKPGDSTTEEPTAKELLLSDLIIGKWMDSANMSGYEFFENGKVTVTYVNLTIPFIELPINGTATGTYTLSDNNLTVKFSIYSKTITKRFTASATAEELTLRDLDDGDVGTYMKTAQGNEVPSSSSAGNISFGDDLVGSWVNGDSSVKYSFASDSTVTVSFFNAKDSSIASSSLNGTFNGIYIAQGNELTVQFMMNDKKITQNFTYTVSSNSMSLADSKGDTTLFVRGGTGFTPYSSAEDLVGSWKDSSGSVGYTFNDGGIVELTYVNFTIPVINMPISGKYKGTYQVEGNKLTVRYSVAGNSIIDVYTFAVNGNTLVLTNTENGKVTSYMK